MCFGVVFSSKIAWYRHSVLSTDDGRQNGHNVDFIEAFDICCNIMVFVAAAAVAIPAFVGKSS